MQDVIQACTIKFVNDWSCCWGGGEEEITWLKDHSNPLKEVLIHQNGLCCSMVLKHLHADLGW